VCILFGEKFSLITTFNKMQFYGHILSHHWEGDRDRERERGERERNFADKFIS
jgi:hypothetical protein